MARFPYKTLTVKIGGSSLSNISDIISDMKEALSSYEKILVTHGGADKVDDEMRRRGLEIKRIRSPKGIESRHTYPEARDVYVEVMERITSLFVDSLTLQNVRAHGFSAKEVPIIAKRKYNVVDVSTDEDGKLRKVIIRDDYSGRIEKIDAEKLSRCFENYSVIVVPPIGSDPISGELNINGDKAAAYLAGSTDSEIIINLTDVNGVMLEGKIIPRIKYDELEEFLEKSDVRGGMKRKILHARQAFEVGNNLKKFIIANGLKHAPITTALYEEGEEGCTVIVR